MWETKQVVLIMNRYEYQRENQKHWYKMPFKKKFNIYSTFKSRPLSNL